MNDRLKRSTQLSLLFAVASILLFHGFNAWLYMAGRKAPKTAQG
jgi:hypothetical protein